MIYIIHGDDINLKDKAFTNIKSIYGDSIFDINTETERSGERLLSHIHSIDLWGVKQIIAIDNLLGDIDFKDILYENLDEIKNSDNVFVIYEREINAAVFTKIKKFSTKVYDVTNTRVALDTKPFLLCDYVAARDKRHAWPELLRLYEHDVAAEAIQGALWWKLKSIWHGTKYSRAEIERLSYDLILIGARAHSGECDFRVGLERWVLSI